MEEAKSGLDHHFFVGLLLPNYLLYSYRSALYHPVPPAL